MRNKYREPNEANHSINGKWEAGKSKKSFMSRRTVGDVVFDVINMIIMIVFTITMLYPLLNTVAVSINDGTGALRGGIHLIP